MKNLYELLKDFILNYLPKEKGYSKHTSLAYYTAIKTFINWYTNNSSKKKAELNVYDFNFDNVSKFLSHIEENGSSTSTRNQRRASLISFVSYCSMIEPLYQNTLDSIRKVKPKKDVKKKLDFLTIEEYKDYLSVIDLKSPNGLRHYTIINLMYDAAARVSELINIKVEDLNYGSANSIKIYGKGKKYRIVYITKHTVKLIEDYLNKYKITEGYIFRNNQGKQISRFGVEHIVRTYYQKVSKISSSIKVKNVTPHTFRHTKACHMLINGTALPIIQRFLGHSSVQTTEIYLDLTSEAVIKAVEKAGELIEIEEDEFIEAKWNDDEIKRKLNDLFKNSQ